jgi:DNA adenine methylase
MSLFRYPGGKGKLKKVIHSKLMGMMESQPNFYSTLDYQYREPFFGGGSISLDFISKSTPFSSLWLNDRDISLCCLWNSVIHQSEDLINLIKDYTPTVESFYSIKKELIELERFGQMPIDDAIVLSMGFKKLVIHQTSFSGLGLKSGSPLGGKLQESKYKIDCRWNSALLERKVRELSNRFSKISLEDGMCTNLDFQKVIEKETEYPSILYLDPPYYIKGRELYEHGFSKLDHRRLMLCLKNTHHLWLLSYDDCEEVRELYSWAKIEEINVKYSIAGSTEKGELLISR